MLKQLDEAVGKAFEKFKEEFGEDAKLEEGRMTMNDIQKAINELQERINLIGQNYEDMVPEYKDALLMAVSALRRQQPRRPITYEKTNRADCPMCGATVRGIKDPFGNWCSKCGQALDWDGLKED